MSLFSDFDWGYTASSYVSLVQINSQFSFWRCEVKLLAH
jgi:hypothetical protein